MPRDYEFRVFSTDDVWSIGHKWAELSNTSAEDNAYYRPHYAKALLETVEKDCRVRFFTLWQRNELVAFLPVTMNSPLPFTPVNVAWQTLYNYSCTPLVKRDHLATAVPELIAHLRTLKTTEWLLPTLNIDGDVCTALCTTLSDAHAPIKIIEPFNRAFVERGLPFETYFTRHLGKELRKDLARRRRRLEEQGRVSHAIFDHGGDLRLALETFLKMERSGWKGQRGTALDCNGDTRAFAMMAFNSEAPGNVRLDLLQCADRPVAGVLTLVAGRTGFTVKSAYDEQFARFSAAKLLEIEILKSFLGGSWADRLDSGTDGTHVIDDFWPGRMRVGDIAFSLASQSAESRLTRLCDRMARKKRWKVRIKTLLGRN